MTMRGASADAPGKTTRGWARCSATRRLWDGTGLRLVRCAAGLAVGFGSLSIRAVAGGSAETA